MFLKGILIFEKETEQGKRGPDPAKSVARNPKVT